MVTSIQQALTAALNSPPAHSLGDAHYRPKHQDYYSASSDGLWKSTSPSQSPAVVSPPDISLNPHAIRLISWNIDVLVGFAQERMRAALEYLDVLVSSAPADVPVVVFLQEMGRSDLQLIRDSSWIKQRFKITELDNRNWLGPLYGTTTLVDRRLKIKDVFRVPWISKFQRDGLFVDISLSDPEAEPRVLRLCNTHLESLVADPPVRPLQVAVASEYLQKPDIACALLAGDMNAIQPFDRTLHTENALKDTYLELGGQEDSDDGYTWGQQAPHWLRNKFGCSRMDKILFRGDIMPKTFERIGMGVKVAEEVREEVERGIEGGWVTDHYGVMADFEFTSGCKLLI
jgi:tyrosyl-DNA phosphodiesterase 2